MCDAWDQSSADVSPAEGRWPKTAHSLASFPDSAAAAAGAGLPNQAGFGQDVTAAPATGASGFA